MKSYCLKCKKQTESVSPKKQQSRTGRNMILSKCKTCNSKKSTFTK